VTTYLALRNKVMQLLAQYNRGVAVSSAAADVAGQTVYDRLVDAYRDLVDDVAVRQGELVCDMQDFTYAAGSEYVDLHTTPATSLWQRRIVSLVRKYNDERRPLLRLSREQCEEGDCVVEDSEYEYGFHVQNRNLFVLPKPTEALTLRALYVPKIAALTFVGDGTGDDIEEPSLLPEEHHDLIAHKAALSFKGEASLDLGALEKAVHAKTVRFNLWAGGHASGPRYVRS
jgi:hypothetical protein